MKNWADHCSSDEEDNNNHEHDVDDEKAEAEEEVEVAPEEDVAATNEGKVETSTERQPRIYEFPTEPPFTAYVGNIAYNVTDPHELASHITDAVREHTQVEIHVSEPRILKNREDKRHRGFGYIHVESLEELKAVLQLNEADCIIQGRRLQFDTAGKKKRASHSNVDGSQFRRHSRKQQENADQPPQQRPSLKLQPRTKPREEAGPSTSSGNIFGAGKARDDQDWRDRSKKPSEGRGRDDHASGRGNRNSGEHSNNHNHRGGRGASGRGRGGRSSDGPKKMDKSKKPEKKPQQPTVTTEMEKKVAPPTTAVSNKFAALGFDSDSE